ncbi:MAG: hypothetical protein HZC37_17480 [Burkholderiales bacterium]|nr:hypothetical protein [Burkholderiales bacterium]
MKALAVAAAGLVARWRQAQELLDTMPSRERLALLALALAALMAAEFLVVLPMREQRQVVASALDAETEAAAAAEQARTEQLAQEQAALESRLAAVEWELRRRGTGGLRSESLGAWMQRALAGQPVRVVALRDQGVQEIDAAAVTAGAAGDGADRAHGASAANGAGVPATAAAVVAAAATDPAAPAAAATLYRHRYELTLAGEVADLGAAMQVLAERLAPLRIERVRLSSGDGIAVHATLGFVIVAPQRTWIAL